jgi:hypothetical protein
MSEATTRSLFLLQRVIGLTNGAEFSIMDGANSLGEIAKNAFRKAIEGANDMISDDDDNLNYTLALYNNLYTLVNPTDIREFLKNNKYLIPLISEAYHKLQVFFPPSTVFMEVLQNEMVISVGTSLSANEAKNKLDEFDERWWLNECIKSNAKLCITVEFQ